MVTFAIHFCDKYFDLQVNGWLYVLSVLYDLAILTKLSKGESDE